MLCSDLMKRNVERCLDTSLVTEAASAMRDRNVGFLPITTEDATVVGAITDRDLAVRVLAEDRAPDRTTVTDVMTHEVVSCSADDELSVAEDLMSRFQKSRIICTDPKRHVVGVISLSNLAHTESGGHSDAVAASIAAREAFVPGDLPTDRDELRCRDAMKTDVVSCDSTTTVTEIAALMRDRNVGLVVVTDDKGNATGTVTDRDLVLRVIAERRDPTTTHARDVTTADLVSCSADDPLVMVEDLMLRHRKSRIVCIDSHRRPVGVVSLSDLARIERDGRVSELLRGLSSRARPTPA